MVPLAPLTDPHLVPSAIRQALGVQEAGAQPLDALAAHIGSRHLLLLLDNFEHLLPAAPFVAELLARCPRLRLLVTSRAALRLRAEHLRPISPLQVPGLEEQPLDDLARVPSVALFVRCARFSSADFQLTGSNAGAVAQLLPRNSKRYFGIRARMGF